jgi:predicted GNAT family acetyltransferase
MSVKPIPYKEDLMINDLPIFFQPWWLDKVCRDGKWGMCISKLNEREVVGVLTYYLISYFGLKIIRTPPFTPHLGVWLDYSSCSDKKFNRYSFENEVISDLVSQIPKVAWYHQVHPEQLTNWLPFYWRGYKQTIRYTYVLEDSNTEKVFAEMKSEVRTRIRKAEALFVIVENNDMGDFYRFYEKTMKRQNISLKRNRRVLESLHDEIQAREVGKIYYALDSNGNAAAALYMIWDKTTAYYWLPCLDKELGSQGAAQLIIWHSIQEAFKMGKKYNFEGSMLPHIEPVFRAFGAERRPVYQIYKASNRVIYILKELLQPWSL